MTLKNLKKEIRSSVLKWWMWYLLKMIMTNDSSIWQTPQSRQFQVSKTSTLWPFDPSFINSRNQNVKRPKIKTRNPKSLLCYKKGKDLSYHLFLNIMNIHPISAIIFEKWLNKVSKSYMKMNLKNTMKSFIQTQCLTNCRSRMNELNRTTRIM